MAIVCLMTMVLSANAQDDMYYKPINKLSKERTSFWEKEMCFGLGVGVNTTFVGDKSCTGFSFDIIGGGLYCSFTIADADENDKYATETNIQLGYFIPLVKFGDKDSWRSGWDNALLISPIIDFSGVMHFEGEMLHSGDRRIEGHNCHYFIDESYYTKNETGFGIGVMYRYGFGYILAKGTTKSWGISVGFGI